VRDERQKKSDSKIGVKGRGEENGKEGRIREVQDS